jgi:hypothetical protein
MTSKLFLRAGLAGILSFLGLTFVQAQGVPHLPPKAITPEEHNLATNGGTIQSGRGPNLNPTPQVTKAAGWNYFHATSCSPYFDGFTTWVYLYPQEGGVWFTANSIFADAFLNQCSLGNLIAVYVIDTAGHFNQVWTYDYK